MASPTVRKSPSHSPTIGRATVTMTVSADTSDTDWRKRCEELEFEHQLDLERIRLHYDHELKEKVSGKDIHFPSERERNSLPLF